MKTFLVLALGFSLVACGGYSESLNPLPIETEADAGAGGEGGGGATGGGGAGTGGSVPDERCMVDEDCPSPDPSTCFVGRCDPRGRQLVHGRRPGCYVAPADPGTKCSWKVGEITCPGNCSGSAPSYDCQPTEPACGK